MKRKTMTMQSVRNFISRRIVAVSALIAAVALLAGYVSMNLRTVQITDGDQTHSVRTLSTQSGVVMKAVGLSLEEGDEVTAEWEFNKGEIVIARGMDIMVSVDGVTRKVTLTEGTVADALKKAGVTLGEHDMVSDDQATALYEGLSVSVDRVTYKERTETEAIAHGSSSYESSAYNKGEKVVEKAGVDGEKTIVYRDRLVNGEVAQTEKVSESVTKEPVDEVVAVGTYVKPKPVVNNKPATNTGSTSSSAGTIAGYSYSKVLYGKGTAYTNENGLAGKYTSTGMLAQVGVVAVNPNVIPYGTKLYITTADGSITYGYCVAGDTGGFIYSHPDTIVDLFYNTAAECYAFGRRDIVVYVLD